MTPEQATAFLAVLEAIAVHLEGIREELVRVEEGLHDTANIRRNDHR